MKKHLRALLAVIAAAAVMLVQTGCAAATAAANGAGFGEILSAASEDIFGFPEQNCQTVAVSLPRHAGYDISADKNAYDALTTDAQREAYKSLEAAIFSVSDGWSEDFGGWALRYAPIPSLTSAEIFIVKEAVLSDHPEAFWVMSSYAIGSNMRDGSYICMYSAYNYSQITDMLLRLERSIIAVLKEIPSNRSEYERELLIHDILVRNISYDTSAAAMADSFTDAATVYGALVGGRAICTGYAQAFKLLCGRLGLSCITVKGMSKGEAHMWNIVRLDGAWYHIDVTWDDPVPALGVSALATEMMRYDYLNLSDSWIAFDHEIADGYDQLVALLEQNPNYSGAAFYNFPLPSCSSTRYNFYRLNAVRITALGDLQAQQITEQMRQARAEGREYLYLSFDNDMDADAVVEWLTAAIGDSIALINAEPDSASLPLIDHCVRAVRGEDAPAHWGNLHCIKLIYSELSF